MQKNKTLKGLLAVSAVAAMFSAFGVQAQTSTGSSPSQTGTSSTNPNQAGKTTKEGTIDNTNSTGMENRSNEGTASGMHGSTGASSSGHQSSGSSSSSGAAGMTGKSSSGMHSGSSGASGAGQTAAGSSAAGAKLSAGDQKILKDIAMADMGEIEGGKLAQSKGQSSEVKSFGQQMIDDHSANLKEVQALAQARGVTLPTEPDAKHKAMAAKLEKMSGDAFDKAYMKQAGVQDHKTVHSKLMAASKKAKDPEVKALVEKTEPVVAQHLKSAEQMPMAKSGTTAGK
jgi:predicted outer membrane protein